MACARSKHIIHPARFENQNLTNTQGEYLIEKSSTRMHNKPARCTLTGYILAIDKKNSDTTCLPPRKQKRTRKLCHQYFPSLLYIGRPIKVEHISAEQLGVVLQNLPLKQFSNVLRILLPSLLHMLCAIMYQDSHGSSSAIQCKDVHQRHFMDGCAIAHLCKSKYFHLLHQLSLV